jgi:hypothetical protein
MTLLHGLMQLNCIAATSTLIQQCPPSRSHVAWPSPPQLNLRPPLQQRDPPTIKSSAPARVVPVSLSLSQQQKQQQEQQQQQQQQQQGPSMTTPQSRSINHTPDESSSLNLLEAAQVISSDLTISSLHLSRGSVTLHIRAQPRRRLVLLHRCPFNPSLFPVLTNLSASCHAVRPRSPATFLLLLLHFLFLFLFFLASAARS